MASTIDTAYSSERSAGMRSSSASLTGGCARSAGSRPVRPWSSQRWVPNHGLIDNLPEGCCVEVSCLVDANGEQPVHAGPLPLPLAGLMRTNVNVQELVVEAALTGSREAVHDAIALDPLTAAACTLPQIRTMTDELLAAKAPWLPALR